MQKFEVDESLKNEIESVVKAKRTRKEILTETLPYLIEKIVPDVKDKSQICSILQQKFPKGWARDIRRYCPEEFRRNYKKRLISIDNVDELLGLMEEVLGDLYKISRDMRKNPEVKQQACISLYLELGENFDEFYTETKERCVDVELLRNHFDKRKKIDSLGRLLLPILAQYNTPSSVAKKHNIVPRRLKQLIDKQNEPDNPELKVLFEIWKSDSKFKPLIKWFEENKKRICQGLESKPIPGSKA